ncbi:D-aminoacyl-tRNA deacylase 1 [Cololabis saira]|uniref:D-aminoacyl-tRNA deacylase 1 n=1 Tax=Cololabis saira TaxID=129043 RepID=UPI002AD202C5|nr:D-aminoacyl-tRNA deacylase 1 [Cololabis saira]
MKAVIQRVAEASVTVGGARISSIGPGLCVLLGINVDDTEKETEYMVRKILNLRLFEDGSGSGRAWSCSVVDRDLEVLLVSQFTLQAVLKGNKPDFHQAMPAQRAEPFYNRVLEEMRSKYRPDRVKDGKFGAHMQLQIQNDGPVTIELSSPAGPGDPRLQSKQEKQQQRKDKSRSKGPAESGDKGSRPDPGTSSGAEGQVSSEREA